MGKLKKETIAAPLTKRKGAAVMWLVTIALIPMVLGYFLYTAEVDQSGIDLPQMPTVTPVPPGSQVTNITIGDIGNEEAAPAPTALPLPTPDGRIDELAAGAQQQTLSIERLTDRVSLQETAVAELADEVAAGLDTADDERDELTADVERLAIDLDWLERQQDEDFQAFRTVTFGSVAVTGTVAVLGVIALIVFGRNPQPSQPTQELPVNTGITPELPEVETPDVNTGITGNSAVNTAGNTPGFEFFDLLGGYFDNGQIARIAAGRVDRDTPPDWFVRGVKLMERNDIKRNRIASAVGFTGRNYKKLRKVLDT